MDESHSSPINSNTEANVSATIQDKYGNTYGVSTKFSKLYVDTYLPSSTKIRHLRMTDEYFYLLLDHVDRVVQCVNNHGGWTVVGWHKCGVINDCTLVGNNSNTSGNSNSNNNEDVH
eukprot:8409397-Ditylum_brightwellii.AAC.1